MQKFKKYLVENADALKSNHFPKVSTAPHMDTETVEFLKYRLPKIRTYIEFGAGGSTLLAYSLNVPTIISVETDLRWIGRIKRSMKKSNLQPKLYFCMRMLAKPQPGVSLKTKL